MNYFEDGGLSLISADPISAEKANPRPPNGQGGYFEIPVRIDWLDEEGKIATGTDCLLPVGIRTPASDHTIPPGMLLPEQMIVLRVPGPEAGFTGKVRISRIGNFRKHTEARSPALKADFTFPLQAPFAAQYNPPPDPVSSEKIRDTGPDGKRLVMVFLGDGYTQAELDGGKYATDVEKTLTAFTAASPWDQMTKATNVYRVSVASNQSGADYDNGAPGAGGTLKDTYFETGFHAYGIPQLLMPTAAGENRARAAADNMVGAGVWDQIVIVVNSSVYGGAGGFLAVNSMHANGPLISVHEVAHSLAGLADEYESPLAVYDGIPVTEPNIDTNGVSPKWGIWIDSPAPPLPTPDTAAYANRIGAFEGARYHEYGLYRPARNCGMRTLNVPFCHVCTEQHLKSFFAVVPLADSASPAASTTVSVTSSRTFSVNSIPIDEITYEWFLGGTKINGAGSASLALSTAQLTAPSQQLTATARYSSAMMRSGAPQAGFSWTVQNNGVTPAGTPHWWLASHQLGASSGEDQLDHDGDGLTTRAEYIAGTDPRSRGSVLAFSVSSIAPAGGTLKFETIAGRRYRIERATGLDDWQSVPGYENITGGQGPVTYSPPASANTKRFFRIAVWIP